MKRYSATVYREVRQAVVITFEANSKSEASAIARAMMDSVPEDKWDAREVLAGGILHITEVK